MKIKGFILLLILLIFNSHTNGVKAANKVDYSNPLAFFIPDKDSSYEEILAFLSTIPQVKIENSKKRVDNSGYIRVIYDGGIDWFTGCNGHHYITDIYISDNKVSLIKMIVAKKVPLFDDAKIRCQILSKIYGFEPECKHVTYKPRGSERYTYSWLITGFKISIDIVDYDETWYDWYDIWIIPQ